MPNTLYTRAFTGNKEVYKIEQRTFWQGIRSQFWGPFIGKTTPDGMMIKPLETSAQPVENPIAMHRQLITKMGDTLQIPTIRQLKGMPKRGNEQLKDQEERFFANHMEVPVDTMRHAALPYEGKIMRQTTKELDLVNKASMGLKGHFSRCMEYLGPSYALYYGYSHNILAGNPRWSSHSYIKTISHPHIFAPGISGGKVAYTTGNPSSAGYETDVENAVANISSSDIITAATLRALTKQPQIRRIKPLIMKNGKKLRCIVLHPFQLATLEEDSEFNQNTASMNASILAKDNPLLFAASYVYGGWAIFQSDTAVWPARVTSGTVEFGPTLINTTSYAGNLDTFEDYANDTVFAGLILGANAVGMGVASGMEFVRRMDDYDHLHGLGWDMILGFSRGDSWNRDDGTLGDTIINDGSALLLSYAPQPAL